MSQNNLESRAVLPSYSHQIPLLAHLQRKSQFMRSYVMSLIYTAHQVRCKPIFSHYELTDYHYESTCYVCLQLLLTLLKYFNQRTSVLQQFNSCRQVCICILLIFLVIKIK